MVKLDTPELLDELGFFQDDFKILDIGCGIAPIARYCLHNRKRVDYNGIDIISANIRYCRAAFPIYRFFNPNIKSEFYSPNGKIHPINFHIPLDNNSIDSIICHSLFTHLDTEEIAAHYLEEIGRVLKKGGFLWTTWFASPPNTVGGGTPRTVYPLDFIHRKLAEYEPIYQSGGDTQGYHDQLEIACVKT